MSGCFSPLLLTTNPTHLDDLNDSHIEESEVVSATQYQDDFSLVVFSLNHISLAMIQPKSFSPSLPNEVSHHLSYLSCHHSAHCS